MSNLNYLVAVFLLVSGSALSYGQSNPIASYSNPEQEVNDAAGSDYEAGDKLMARADIEITFPPGSIIWEYTIRIEICDSDTQSVVATNNFAGEAFSGDTVFALDRSVVFNPAGTAQAYFVTVRAIAKEKGTTGPPTIG